MRKILTIAIREYRAMVATKAFLISIAIMPLLMFGGMVAAFFLQQAGSTQVKKIAIYDETGVFFEVISARVSSPKEIGDKSEHADLEFDDAGDAVGANSDSSFAKNLEAKQTDGEDSPTAPFEQPKIRFELERIDTSQPLDDAAKLALSERIRANDLYAFIEIPKDIADLNSASIAQFYSEDSSLSESRQVMKSIIGEEVKKRRLQKLNIDQDQVRLASAPVVLTPRGLVQQSSSGAIENDGARDIIVALMLPMAIMMLMFMVIFLSAQPMLESVLEEKSQRIAEVLLGSANPFQLMAGKLLGTVAGSLTVFSIYFFGVFASAYSKGWHQYIPIEIAPWFVIFQVLGVMFYASIFMAVGASVSQLKEAQSILLPVWMMMMSPMFVWIFAVREPNGSLATWFSFFPPAIPTMMMLRLATGSTIAIWQPIVGAILLAICTVACVFVASRIFRVGILWQGTTPKLSQIFRWGLFG